MSCYRIWQGPQMFRGISQQLSEREISAQMVASFGVYRHIIYHSIEPPSWFSILPISRSEKLNAPPLPGNLAPSVVICHYSCSGCWLTIGREVHLERLALKLWTTFSSSLPRLHSAATTSNKKSSGRYWRIFSLNYEWESSLSLWTNSGRSNQQEACEAGTCPKYLRRHAGFGGQPLLRD